MMQLNVLSLIALSIILVISKVPTASGLQCVSCEYLLTNGEFSKGEEGCYKATNFEQVRKPCDRLHEAVNGNEVGQTRQPYILTCIKTDAQVTKGGNTLTKVTRGCFAYNRVFWNETKNEGGLGTSICETVLPGETAKANEIWKAVRGTIENNALWNDDNIQACFCGDEDGCNGASGLAIGPLVVTIIMGMGVYLNNYF